MNPATQSILADFLNVALLVLAMGIPAYALLRRGNPTAAWERSGNVWTGPFHGFDLIVVLGIILAARTMVTADRTPPDPASYTATGILTGSLFFIVIAAGLIFFLILRQANLTETFGLDRLGPRALLLWTTIGTATAILATQGIGLLWQKSIIGPAWHGEGEQPLVQLLRHSPDQGLRLTIALTACILQPVTEEIIFRGYFYPAVKRHGDRMLAALLSAMVFAAMHFHVPTLAPLFFLGIFLALSYEASGSLWVPIGIHALFNTATVVYQLASSSPT